MGSAGLIRSLLSALAITLMAASANAQTVPQRPSIIFILADDLGWTDLGCQGSGFYQTPHIDRLAKEGLRATSAYTCGPNCQPTRAALMTGLYGPRTGIYTVGGIDRFDWSSRPLRPVDNVVKLPPKFPTVANVLREAGYATAMFGKWHLGETPEHHPAARGFEEAIVSMGRHLNFRTSPEVDVPAGTYLADFLTDRAEDFIRRHRQQPFFLYLPHFGVHSPYESKPDLTARFLNRPAVEGHRNPVYAAMIASVDESVGRILSLLDELQLAQNTLVIFSSDNGGVGGYVREGVKTSGDVTDNAPLRSGKGSLYEGGVRVPWIARWPGTIPAGTTSVPLISVDLLPTLADVAGVPGENVPPGDGISLAACLRSGGQDAPVRDLFWHFPGYLGAGQGAWRTTPVSAIRSGRWKLLEFLEDHRVELYDLETDLSQTNNLAESAPDTTSELLKKLNLWRTTVAAPMPRSNR
ncbi:MAG: sulfatase [Planctomycetota bacterium]